MHMLTADISIKERKLEEFKIKRKKRRRRKETVSQYIQTLLQKRCGDNDNNKI